MEIIIDTNIIFGDWALRSPDGAGFLEYIKRTGSIVYVPRIVWQEVRKNYYDFLAEKHRQYEKASKEFGRTMVVQPQLKIVPLKYGEEADKYLEWLKETLLFDGEENILPFGNYTERLANRVQNRRKPFNSENDREFKDSIIWETVIDVLTKEMGRGHKEVVFISHDSDAYAAEADGQTKGKRNRQKDVLHPELQLDVNVALGTASSRQFYYYDSIAAFLAEHYLPIQGIDASSVLHFLQTPSSNFGQAITRALNVRDNSVHLMLAIEAANPGSQVYALLADNFTVEEVSEVDEFYVYSAQKGTTVTASGRVKAQIKLPISYKSDPRSRLVKTMLTSVFSVKFIIVYENGSPIEIAATDANIISSDGLILPSSRTAVIQWAESQPERDEAKRRAVMRVWNAMMEADMRGGEYFEPAGIGRFSLDEGSIVYSEPEYLAVQGRYRPTSSTSGKGSKFIPNRTEFVSFKGAPSKRKNKKTRKGK